MSNNLMFLGNLDMLKSMYDFKPTYAKTLGFKANDYFILHQMNTKHKNWWQVMNERGEVGFIPSNYVETITVCPAFYLNFLDNCIIHIKNNEISPEYMISSKEEVVLRLQELKRRIEQLPELSTNSISSNSDLPPLLFKNADGDIENLKGERVSSQDLNSKSSSLSYVKSSKDVIEEPIKPVKKSAMSKETLKKSLESIHDEIVREEKEARRGSKIKEVSSKKSFESRNDDKRESLHSSPRHNHTNNSTKISPTITQQSVYELVENVRINTQLSHELSRVAVCTVVQGLHDLLPSNAFPYLSTIVKHVENCLVDDNIQIDQTHDASRLKIIFNELTSCKEDSQQRSWMLHEDEDVIVDYISELLSILSNADSTISKYMLSMNDFNVINTLIQYYQMEVRWSIRQLLLQAFGVMCSLDKTIISIMLNSVLPGELARDMTANPRNIAKLNYSVLLLTMIYSMGEPMPITDLQYLGESFLSFILNHIEYPPDTDVDEQIPDMFVHFILSFNLQFKTVSDNVVLRALSQRDVSKTFTEKILLLLNREEDPARLFDHQPAPPNSVLKMFNDLFSYEETADIFYTNDVKVLIDIIVRNIADLSAGDKRRGDYLELCRRVLRTTNYNDHLHRRDDLLKCFTRIFCEESDQSKLDQSLVKDILNEFPQYFK